MKKTHPHRLLRKFQALYKKLEAGRLVHVPKKKRKDGKKEEGYYEEDELSSVLKRLTTLRVIDVRTKDDMNTVAILKKKGFDGCLNVLGGVTKNVAEAMAKQAASLKIPLQYSKKKYGNLTSSPSTQE
ncbi:hypothetical protein ACH5RR_034567 [Cinchona calisaya]|uniref:Uncharacterized protein n=1 Tax=Cinchona calisaya TaxID=153742 RepID=A0ABD2YBA9_9GENT